MIKQPHYIGLEEARQLLTQMGQPAGGFAASVRFCRSEPSSLLTRRWREPDSNHRSRSWLPRPELGSRWGLACLATFCIGEARHFVTARQSIAINGVDTVAA